MHLMVPNEIKTVMEQWQGGAAAGRNVTKLVNQGWVILSSHQLPDNSGNDEVTYFTLAKFS